jgi:hypothetical protein
MQLATAGSSVARSFTAGGARMSAEAIILLFALVALIVIVTTDDFGGPA